MRVRFKLTRGKHYARANGRSVIVYLDGGTNKKTDGGHYLVAGDVIECPPEMLKYFMDKFEKLDPDPPPPQPKVGLLAVETGEGLFDVINSTTGETINDAPLTESVALSLTEGKRGEKSEVTTLDDKEPQFVYVEIIAEDET